MTVNLNKLLWVSIEGLEKEEILEAMGFQISSYGYIANKEGIIRDLDGESVTLDSLKAIIPNPEGPGIAFITDISQIERYMENE